MTTSEDIQGYSQTYIVKTTGSECQGDSEQVLREAFFQCGNHCYTGQVEIDLQLAFGELTLGDIPTLVPLVQRQQNDLTYLCNKSSIPTSSPFRETLKAMESALYFVVSEITSNSMASRMAKLKMKHPWIDEDESCYFELIGDTSSIKNIMFSASRVYAKGMIFTTIYFEGIVYVTLADGNCESPLLDIKFPDISGSSGEGVTLALYVSTVSQWMKLSLWQIQASEDHDGQARPIVSPVPSIDLSSDSYIQSYCVLKGNSEIRDVMFAFGSWTYSGKVEVGQISLVNIPQIIRSLRYQQSKLSYVSDTKCLPSSNPHALAMQYAAQRQHAMEALAAGSEEYLRHLITVRHQYWLDDDESDSFFEFACNNDDKFLKALGHIDLIATKKYNPNGLVSISLYFNGSWYLSVSEGNDFPLLDSKFPDLSSTKRSGFKIDSYPNGLDGWPQLRKISLWCIERGEGNSAVEEEPSSGSNSSETDGVDQQSEAKTPPCGVQNEAVPTPSQSDHCDTTEQDPSATTEVHTLEKRLKEIGDAAKREETAWDEDGCPKSNSASFLIDNAESDENNSQGDIYSQLDRLNEKLDRELSGLSGLLE